MAVNRAPKQWCLTKTETIKSFESWKQNLQYTLSLLPNFAIFLTDNIVWTKKALPTLPAASQTTIKTSPKEHDAQPHRR